MKAFLNQNQQALAQVLSNMRRNLTSTLMMCAVLGVTLCLPGTLYVVIDNLSALAGNVQSEPRISLFLKRDIQVEQTKSIESQLQNMSDVASYVFVDKESALKQLQDDPNTANVAGNLDKNPLPDAYFVTPKNNNPESIESLQKTMQSWDGVELAQVDANWIKRLHAILALGQKGVIALVILLGFALIAIIGNTIRLQILTQREEIEVSKLIGATDGFIKRPFLYAGIIYGLGGGIAACILLMGVIALFNFSVADIAKLYASDFRLSLPSFQANLTIILSAVTLGLVSSYLAVSKSLAYLNNH